MLHLFLFKNVNINITLCLHFCLSWLFMCGHYFCTIPKFLIFLYFILTTICTYAFHFNIIYNSIYILNKNKIKCVYPSRISYYKFNVYIDNNTCIYFCLNVNINFTLCLHFCLSWLFMWWHYFCTRPKFSVFLYFILTTICTRAFYFNIIYNSMYILNQNKIKCVYPRISYYKFNVSIDNNNCIYFCLKMLTSILHYVCIV